MIGSIGGGKEFEEALRESEKRYRTLFETMPDGFVSIGMDGRIVEANPAFCAMTGYARGEISSLPYSDLKAGEGYDSEDRIVLEQVLATGHSDPYEREYARKDGTILQVEIRMFLTRDEKSGSSEIWAFVRNVSRRKKVHMALQESEDRYRRVVDLSPGGILIHVDGRIEFANRSFARMIGADRPEELYGRSIFDFPHPDCLGVVASRIKAIETGGAQTPLAEHKLVRLDGVVIDVEATGFPFLYKGHKAGMTVMDDITQRKRAEEELKRREKELNKKSFDLEEANTALKVLLRHRNRTGRRSKTPSRRTSGSSSFLTSRS